MANKYKVTFKKSTFFSFIFAFLFTSLSFALDCNPAYDPKSAAKINLTQDEQNIVKKVNQALQPVSMKLTNPGDFVLIQMQIVENNYLLKNRNKADEPSISDMSFTRNILASLNSARDATLKNEISFKNNKVKNNVLNVVEKGIALANHILNQNSKSEVLNYLNAFLAYHSSQMGILFKDLATTCQLTEYEISAIHIYTGEHYSSINSSLRKDPESNYKRNLKNIYNNALEKIAPYAGAVLRGSNLKEPYLSEHKIGNTVKYTGLTSTSISEPFPGEFQFTIISKTGRDISELSLSPDEQEVLFKPDSQFYIQNRIENHFYMSEI